MSGSWSTVRGLKVGLNVRLIWVNWVHRLNRLGLLRCRSFLQVWLDMFLELVNQERFHSGSAAAIMGFAVRLAVNSL